MANKVWRGRPRPRAATRQARAAKLVYARSRGDSRPPAVQGERSSPAGPFKPFFGLSGAFLRRKLGFVPWGLRRFHAGLQILGAPSLSRSLRQGGKPASKQLGYEDLHRGAVKQ